MPSEDNLQEVKGTTLVTEKASRKKEGQRIIIIGSCSVDYVNQNNSLTTEVKVSVDKIVANEEEEVEYIKDFMMLDKGEIQKKKSKMEEKECKKLEDVEKAFKAYNGLLLTKAIKY
ncbi:hypothetical protein ACH5RR_001165 [Cinchona calisaya]|uniref:Uncharacterized protein n=1 Tax=Cinchona calisaya TaxID=153742 RepID=A0ABD3B3U4_9GENT